MHPSPPPAIRVPRGDRSGRRSGRSRFPARTREPWAVAGVPSRGKSSGGGRGGARGPGRLLQAAGGVAPGASACSGRGLIRRGPGGAGEGLRPPAPPRLAGGAGTTGERGAAGAAAAGACERAMGKSASKQFNDEVLKAHNEYRRQHGVPPLKLCKKLNREAQQYSEALASTRILKHSPESSRGQCGENLAWASYDQTGKMLETAALLSEAFSNPSGRVSPPSGAAHSWEFLGRGPSGFPQRGSPQARCAHAPEAGRSLQPAAPSPGRGRGPEWAQERGEGWEEACMSHGSIPALRWLPVEPGAGPPLSGPSFSLSTEEDWGGGF
uniref:Golgi-associated plant pathogenesis-related protein 1 n=1 Tax=Equus asinus TaxID=9793 RepID=A0A9L0I5Y0_EQUAS